MKTRINIVCNPNLLNNSQLNSINQSIPSIYPQNLIEHETIQYGQDELQKYILQSLIKLIQQSII